MAEITTTTTEVEPASLSERIHAVRTDLFDIMAVVDIAGRAISSDDDWCLHHALERVVERIDGACAVLELVALDARQLQGVCDGR